MASGVKENLKTEEVDKKVNETIKQINNSEMAKKIPTKFEAVGIDDLVKIALAAKFLWVFPSYLPHIVKSETDTIGIKQVSFIFEIIFAVILFGDILLSSAVFFLGLKKALSFTCLVGALKAVVVAVWIALYTLPKLTLFRFCIWLGFALEVVFFEFVFFYYLNLYFAKKPENVNEEV